MLLFYSPTLVVQLSSSPAASHCFNSCTVASITTVSYVIVIIQEIRNRHINNRNHINI